MNWSSAAADWNQNRSQKLTSGIQLRAHQRTPVLSARGFVRMFSLQRASKDLVTRKMKFSVKVLNIE